MLEKIHHEIQKAMRAKDYVRLLVLRNIVSSCEYEAMSKGKEKLEDKDCIAIIRRLIKQRNDSIEQYTKGGREDLASTEKAELKILEEYVPAFLPEEEIKKIAKAKKEELQITDKKDLGKFLGTLMKDLKDKADGSIVKKVVESLFN